jgi:hypothetical protein
MKSIFVIGFLVVLVSCKKSSTGDLDNSGMAKENSIKKEVWEQSDQMGRPAINTVFNVPADKDAFNVTTPSTMNSLFGTKFYNRLLALNPGYTTNLLGLNAATFTSVLSTDVLNVSKTGATTFYDGTNVLTGRKLEDDVIDVELTLIFGGPTGTSNPSLTSDHVNANDAPFSTHFPYLASPH